ncbi:MAG: DUF6209 family protein [Myxococcales bacterium]
MNRSFRILSVAFSLLLSACGTNPAVIEPVIIHAQSGQAPGQALSGMDDQSDHACQVVLRGVQRQPDFQNGGFKQSCQDEVCAWVWEGQIDASKDAFAVAPQVFVLYHLESDARWWEAEAVANGSGQPGFWHYTFQIAEHLIGASATEAELAAARVQLIPYVRLDGGARLFDHNRRPGDLDNYSFGSSEYFSVGGDGSCVAVAGTVAFFDNFQLYRTGVLHAGGWFAIDYDLDRLPQCRATHNGFPAWGTTAYVRFNPSGEVASGPVNEFERVNGVPTNKALDKRFEVKIPAGTTSAEVWFKNESGAGNSCESWDSNYGANYSFDVLPAIDDPRCQGVESWTNHYGGTEACLAYSVDAHYSATHCELYVDGFGRGHEGHYGIANDWVEAWIVVGPQQGEVLNVGQLTRYVDNSVANGPSRERFSLGTPVDGKWKTGFTFVTTAMNGNHNYTVEKVAFFVDVRRPDGQVVRLWQSRDGANYSLDDAFGAGTTVQYIPYGNVQWANDGAGIFDTRRSCR